MCLRGFLDAGCCLEFIFFKKNALKIQKKNILSARNVYRQDSNLRLTSYNQTAATTLRPATKELIWSAFESFRT